MQRTFAGHCCGAGEAAPPGERSGEAVRGLSRRDLGGRVRLDPSTGPVVPAELRTILVRMRRDCPMGPSLKECAIRGAETSVSVVLILLCSP